MARMDVREKLVDIVKKAAYSSLPSNTEDFHLNMFVTNLLSHGVTVQEWISVDDRLPDSCGFPCLMCGENSFGQIRVFEGFTGYMERGKFEWHSNQKDIDIDVWTITHWMPIPQPPKGE